MSAYKSLGYVRVDQQAQDNLRAIWRKQERRLLWLGVGFIIAAIGIPLLAVVWLAQ